MDLRRTRSLAVRPAVHLVFGLCLAGTVIYYLRLAQEPHVALGIQGTGQQNVVYVRDNSPADRAGIRVGDDIVPAIRDDETGFNDDLTTLTLGVSRGAEARVVTIKLEESLTLGRRLAWMPPDMVTTTVVGVLALLLGWWIFARNPEAPSIVPFALWGAVTGPYWVTATWSSYWSPEMWSVSTICGIPAETALQAFSLHWLLIFPKRIASRWVIVLMYGIFLLAVLALFVVAIATQEKPYDLMSVKGMVAAITSIAVCSVQLRRADTIKVRRRASWVMAGIVLFSLVSFFLWDAPDLAGIALPFGGVSEELIIAITYLTIPVGVAIAITREGLFGIDRFITRGLALGATLLLLFFLYVSAAYVTTSAAGIVDRSSIPVFWGFVIACGLAILARPIHLGVEVLLDGLFSHERRAYDEALDAFDRSLSTIGDRIELELEVCRAIGLGLGVSNCSVKAQNSTTPADEITQVSVAPGAMSPDSYTVRSVVDTSLPAGVQIRYPIRIGSHHFGTAEIGARQDNVRFTDDDLLFLERLALRCADQSARMELYDQALRRELDFARTRLRIAADLHDDIGSNLSGIALMTETAAHSQDGRDRLLEISRFARSMVDSLRDIVWSIDPDSDSAEQLIDRMKDATSSILAGTRHSFVVHGQFSESASPVFQRNVFLIFKEAIHNASRHAEAENVDITVESEKGTFVLTVSDNGVGFDSSEESDGLGRKSMARRAERIGARLSVNSEPGGGTRITLVARMAQTRHDKPSSED